MVGIVLTSHGGFADGINQSAEMIFGQQQDVAHVILKPDEGPDDIHAKLENAIKDFSDQEQVLFLVAIMPSKYTDEIENSSYIWRAFKIG